MIEAPTLPATWKVVMDAGMVMEDMGPSSPEACVDLAVAKVKRARWPMPTHNGATRRNSGACGRDCRRCDDISSTES